jgi:hypothetical protein
MPLATRKSEEGNRQQGSNKPKSAHCEIDQGFRVA